MSKKAKKDFYNIKDECLTRSQVYWRYAAPVFERLQKAGSEDPLFDNPEGFVRECVEQFQLSRRDGLALRKALEVTEDSTDE